MFLTRQLSRAERIQLAAVVLLFATSLAVLLFTSIVGFFWQGEVDVWRNEIQEAARKSLEGLHEVLNREGQRDAAGNDAAIIESMDRVLRDYPGVEGGVYLGNSLDRFRGYSFPTGKPPGPHLNRPRQEPPPLEAPYIRLQARGDLEAKNAEGTVRVLDVGPSRVMIATLPCTDATPVPCVVWLMRRLTGPEELRGQLLRYQLSTALALLGVVVSLASIVGFVQSVERARTRQEQLQGELRRAEHLAGLGRLLAGVAHEVRNPLAAIHSTVQLWQRYPDAPRTSETLQAVGQAVERINHLVTRLLTFARPANAVREPVSWNSVIAESLPLVAAEAERRRVSCVSELDAQLPAISASLPACQQILLNLLWNALQAMPEGGTLVCSTRYDSTGRRVVVDVQDTGPGIPAADRARLFEPFFTTRPEGTGLGLALCRELAGQMGGTIELVDEPGGTCFRLKFPLTDAEPAP